MPAVATAPATAAAAKATSEGHAAHTKDGDIVGLPGTMPRPIKIALLGAGSGFTPRLCNDILLTPGHCGGEIALVDIDPARLQPMHTIVGRLADRFSSPGRTWTITGHTDRTTALTGADYIICCIEVSGLGCVRHDNDIPARFGVSQCIGDTVGPGGLFKGLRTIPVWLDILKDAERLCPQALVLNYTNPMSMMCLAAVRTTSLPLIGLCHSVQGTSKLLAKRADVPYAEMVWDCAGINHLAWFTRLEHQGRDLYPRLMEKARADLARDPEGKLTRDEAKNLDAWDLVRKDMMLHFGAFITESSGHLSEYLPYYRKRPDLLQRYCRAAYDGQSSFYADEWPKWRAGADANRAKMVEGTTPTEWARSHEYAAFIIEAREKDSPFVLHGNVANTWKGGGPLVANLPHDGIVEVKTVVDRSGFNPCVFGRLPPQMAAICAANMAVYDLGAEAVIRRSKEAAIHALTLDPHTASVCSPAEIRAMTLEMFDAEKDFLPGFK